MQKLNILPKKKVKEILNIINNQWDADIKLDYGFLMNEKGKIYIISKKVSLVNLENLRINSLGIYFGELKDKRLRLSIEGSLLIGPVAKKNTLELTDQQAKQWFMGDDILFEHEDSDFLLIKNKNDFLGCGIIKNKKLLNHVGKARRIG